MFAKAGGWRAPALFVVQGFTQYVGASFAVMLFALMPAATVGWWRLCLSAVILLAWRRPWRKAVGFTRAGVIQAAIFGMFLATMNILFYLAIDRIAMGAAVSLEFAGPVCVAAIAGRRLRERIAIGLAALGVLFIAGFGLDTSSPQVAWGVLFALAAGAAWAAYIVTGRRLAERQFGGAPQGIDMLAVGMSVGALVYFPLAATTFTPAVTSWRTFGFVLAVAVLSSVVPYAIDQVNFGAISAAAFAILTALLPATSVVVAAVMLSQYPNGFELAGLVLISIAVALVRSGTEETEIPELKE